MAIRKSPVKTTHGSIYSKYGKAKRFVTCGHRASLPCWFRAKHKFRFANDSSSQYITEFDWPPYASTWTMPYGIVVWHHVVYTSTSPADFGKVCTQTANKDFVRQGLDTTACFHNITFLNAPAAVHALRKKKTNIEISRKTT